jgi:hypothetical protein
MEIASDRPLFKTILVEMGKVWSALEGQCSGYKQVRKKVLNFRCFSLNLQLLNPAPHSSKLSHNL